MSTVQVFFLLSHSRTAGPCLKGIMEDKYNFGDCFLNRGVERKREKLEVKHNAANRQWLT